MYYNIAYINDDGDCRTVLNQGEDEAAVRARFSERNPGLEIVSVWARPDFVPAKSRPSKPLNPKNLYDRLQTGDGNCAACGINTRSYCGNRYCSNNPMYAQSNKPSRSKAYGLRLFGRLGL
jgi:hypothetical protein